MHREAVQRLLQLNRAFYRDFARPFAESRVHPQPGFRRILAELPRPCRRFLDVGCGSGRLGRFLLENKAIEEYTGVDFSPEMLAAAEIGAPGRYELRDLSEGGCLADLGCFDAIACLGTLQHVPGRENRQRLLAEMAQHLEPRGWLFVATWQFLDSPRQRRKIVPWAAIGLAENQVEANDYLLTWQRGGYGLRYVCLVDAAEMAVMAAASGLEVVAQFRSDGREGNLNLYTVLAFDTASRPMLQSGGVERKRDNGAEGPPANGPGHRDAPG